MLWKEYLWRVCIFWSPSPGNNNKCPFCNAEMEINGAAEELQVYRVRSMICGTGIECLMMPMFFVRVPPGEAAHGG